MKKINYSLLIKFYESLLFVFPKIMYQNTNLLHSKIDRWILTNNFYYIQNLKKLFLFLFLLENKRKRLDKKFLFIIDESLEPYFSKILRKNCYITFEIKDGLEILNTSGLKNKIIAVVYIGEHDLPKTFYSLAAVPVFGFCTPKTYLSKGTFDYSNSNFFSFKSVILFIQVIIAEIFK